MSDYMATWLAFVSTAFFFFAAGIEFGKWQIERRYEQEENAKMIMLGFTKLGRGHWEKIDP